MVFEPTVGYDSDRVAVRSFARPWEVIMSIVVRCPASNVTNQQYNSVHSALQQSGDWPPAGCLIHLAFGDEQNVHVSEIWESQEQLQAFGEKLQPKLAAAGIELAGEPKSSRRST
jgi:hypothetical protein